jgi:UDP:flavonoid glycosyltransferase YjiC (YdhE family)
MARIVLTCWGSHGDVDPFLGLALGLMSRGHDVTIATMEYFRDVITAAGIGFRPIRPAADPSDGALIRRIMDPRRGSERLLREILFPSTEAMFEDLLSAVEGADLLVTHPTTIAAPVVAEYRKVPWASSVLAPLSFFSRYDVPVFPPAPWLKSLERLGSWPGPALIRVARAISRPWSAPVHALRRRLGLPPGGDPLFEGQHSPHLVLALFSRVLAAPQPDWPRQTVVTGHVFHDAPHGTALSSALEEYLQAGPPPVVFTLGSSVVLAAGDFWEESIGAVRRLGIRAVFLAGPGRAAALHRLVTPAILAVDSAPHSLVMPRAAAVVQQCGIGTMAQSLRSGRPMLAVPFSHDQPDNAWRARRLGMARILYPRRYREARVAAELRALLDDPAYTDAARRTAAVVRSEGGVGAACDAIEERFALRQV